MGRLAKALPKLAESYHVFAVDCFGHRESAHDASLYSCRALGDAIIGFARIAIGGHMTTGEVFSQDDVDTFFGILRWIKQNSRKSMLSYLCHGVFGVTGGDKIASGSEAGLIDFGCQRSGVGAG